MLPLSTLAQHHARSSLMSSRNLSSESMVRIAGIK